MSEEAAAEKPKKKGKLPIVLALALVLGGGGFFMMKPKKKEEKKTTLALAEKETELEEFLTNTQDPSRYVKAKISVRLTKDYKEDKFKAEEGDVRDAVIAVFNATPPTDICDAKHRPDLKRALAEAINTALEGPVEDDGGDVKKDTPKRKGKETEKPTKEAESDWDSDTGPVLQVRFSELAMQ